MFEAMWVWQSTSPGSTASGHVNIQGGIHRCRRLGEPDDDTGGDEHGERRRPRAGAREDGPADHGEVDSGGRERWIGRVRHRHIIVGGQALRRRLDLISRTGNTRSSRAVLSRR